MSGDTITHAALKPAATYIDRNWVNFDGTNFLKKHVLARSAYLLLTPASLITTALDTIIGLGAGSRNYSNLWEVQTNQFIYY